MPQTCAMWYLEADVSDQQSLGKRELSAIVVISKEVNPRSNRQDAAI